MISDKILFKLNENKNLSCNKDFCLELAASLHNFYIDKSINGIFENDLIKLIGKSCYDNNVLLMPKQIEFLIQMKKFDRIVLSAPTSFGKSFLIFEYIKRYMASFSLIIYIVHTRALCDEIYKKMVKIFPDDNVIDNIDSIDTKRRNIAVIVSDGQNIFKFDDNIDLLVVDEAYNLDKLHSEERFFAIWNCYRALLKKSKKVFLLGPFISGIAGEDSEGFKLIKTNYSPVGSVLLEKKDLNDDPHSRFVNCAKSGLSTIGFINSKTDIYNEIYSILQSDLPDIYSDSFIEWMDDYFPSFWLLPKLMKKGIGIFHSSFPKYINLFNMSKFNSGVFNGLLTTSALLEGVNTSAEYIVIYDTDYNRKELTPFQFFNLCGRAGRLNKKIIGYIYNYGSPYVEKYEERCRRLYIGYNATEAIDKFDLGKTDFDTEKVKKTIKEKLNLIGINYDEWYECFKFYFGSSSTLLNIIDKYNDFKFDFKKSLTGDLLLKNGKALNQNLLVEYIYFNFIKHTNYKYIPTSKFYVWSALKALLRSKYGGINLNLKEILNDEEFLIINSLESIPEKNQFLVEIMKTAYQYIPNSYNSINILLSEFINHDPFFSFEERSNLNEKYFSRINKYLLGDNDILSKIMNNKGFLPTIITKVKSYIETKYDMKKEYVVKEYYQMIYDAINSINLTDFENINLKQIGIK